MPGWFAIVIENRCLLEINPRFVGQGGLSLPVATVKFSVSEGNGSTGRADVARPRAPARYESDRTGQNRLERELPRQ